jgi:hypothetical protein
MDHTGCHQLVFTLQNNVESVTPGRCAIGYMDHTGCGQLVSRAKALPLPSSSGCHSAPPAV